MKSRSRGGIPGDRLGEKKEERGERTGNVVVKNIGSSAKDLVSSFMDQEKKTRGEGQFQPSQDASLGVASDLKNNLGKMTGDVMTACLTLMGWGPGDFVSSRGTTFKNIVESRALSGQGVLDCRGNGERRERLQAYSRGDVGIGGSIQNIQSCDRRARTTYNPTGKERRGWHKKPLYHWKLRSTELSLGKPLARGGSRLWGKKKIKSDF